MKAKFTYFKNSGKWYAEGNGIVPDDFGIQQYAKLTLADLNGGCAPGLGGAGCDFIWLVEEENSVPRLLIGDL